MLVSATRGQGAPNGGLVLYQGEMGCLLCSCADSPVESEGGQEGGAYLRGLYFGGGCELECGHLFEDI